MLYETVTRKERIKSMFEDMSRQNETIARAAAVARERSVAPQRQEAKELIARLEAAHKEFRKLLPEAAACLTGAVKAGLTPNSVASFNDLERIVRTGDNMFAVLLQDLRALKVEDFLTNGRLTRFTILKEDVPGTIALVGSVRELIPRIESNMRADRGGVREPSVSATVPQLKSSLTPKENPPGWDVRFEK
jgi:hypothetical protein